MKNPIKNLVLLSGAALFTLSTLNAVETDPVGFKTVDVIGEGLTLVGVEFLDSKLLVSQADAVGTNTLTVTGADFDTLLSGSDSYFLDVTSGTNEGVNTLISSWSGDVLTLGDDLDGIVTASSDIVEVVRLPTIGEIFGTVGDVLQGGSATTADLIYMPDPIGSGLAVIYYSTGGFTGTGWRQVGAGGADKNNLPVYFSDGFYILKKSAGDSTITLSGTVKVSSTSVVVGEGFTPFSNVFPSGTTFGNSGLYDAGSPSNSLTGGSATTADLVYTDSDGDGSIELYYYSTGGFTGTGWRVVGGGGTDQTNTPIGSGLGILRKGVGAVSVNRDPGYTL